MAQNHGSQGQQHIGKKIKVNKTLITLLTGVNVSIVALYGSWVSMIWHRCFGFLLRGELNANLI